MASTANTAIAKGQSSPWRRSGSSDRRISGVLAVFFLVASLIALYEVARTPRASSSTANTSQSIRTIRAFYAALNEYLETGDAGAVSQTLAPDALAFVPAQGAMGDDSGLLTYLLALRSTHPQLRFTVEHIDAGDDIAIAIVHSSGIAGEPGSAWLNAPETSQEFFRVRDARIVQHWSTAPDSVLLHSLTVQPIPVEVIQPAHLAIAELTFSPGQHDPQPIEGPALVIVSSGRLTLKGDGSSQVLDIASGIASVPGPAAAVLAEPGQAILIPEHRAFVWNRDAEVVEARIATLVADPHPILAHIPSDRHPPPPALNDVSLLSSDRKTTLGAVTVQPLEFDDRSIPTGTWELEIAWAVLGPGASLPLPAAGAQALTHVISGSATLQTLGQHEPGILHELTNGGDTPVVALVIRIRPSK